MKMLSHGHSTRECMSKACKSRGKLFKMVGVLFLPLSFIACRESSMAPCSSMQQTMLAFFPSQYDSHPPKYI
jgi:hypothetical protein